MSFWRPRSVLQLVLVGFFTALAPLCLAIVFTVQTLEDLAANTRDVTRQVIYVTRLGHDIEGELLELERHTRQYLTLFDEELAVLAQEERALLLRHLSDLQAQVTDHGVDAIALEELLQRLDLSPVDPPAQTDAVTDPAIAADALNQNFAVISDHRRGLQQWLQNWVDELQGSNAARAETVIDALFVQLAFLAIATLALLLLFTYWINKPVQELSKEILKLGTAGLGQTIRISGPQELEELGRQLDWLRQRLQDTEQQKQQFQRHISHELKTPLASLREGTDLLAEQVTGHLSQQQQQVVDIVRRNAIELQRLIENLVDYNELPQQELVFEDINLEKLWEEILANYRLTIDQKGLNLSLRGEATYWYADRHKLKTTLDNLLSNAVNYSPEGGDIDVVWRREAANLIMEIANSGEAIPQEDRSRVFEPFFQSTAKRTGPIKGSGIGLSVARECIESQGGTLELVSHDTYPVCFRLLCPAH
jgi:two-component system, NtrC family, sensor histidine kinase GlrK